MRELARAFTGWRADWVDGAGCTNFRYDATRHDTSNKTVFGKTGNYDWQDACELCLSNPFHASFFVAKLWSYFVPDRARRGDAGRAAGRSTSPTASRSGRSSSAILRHPALYDGRAMIEAAGRLQRRACCARIGSGHRHDRWSWLDDGAGQPLFYPPNVSGWDDRRWLDTSTLARALGHRRLRDARPDTSTRGTTAHPYDPTEDAADRRWRARVAALGNPALTAETQDALARVRRRRAAARRMAQLAAGPVPRDAPERAAPC